MSMGLFNVPASSMLSFSTRCGLGKNGAKPRSSAIGIRNR